MEAEETAFTKQECDYYDAKYMNSCQCASFLLTSFFPPLPKEMVT
jgi:hypothetical protein